MSKIEIFKNMGYKWVFFRVRYELEKKYGYMQKKFKEHSVSNNEYLHFIDIKGINREEAFLKFIKENMKGKNFFNNFNLIEEKEIKNLLSNGIIENADLICGNSFLFFNHYRNFFRNIDWHYNVTSRKSYPKSLHWVNIPDLNREMGDIKFIWELSRFTFVYDLSRAFLITRDSKYSMKFWALFEDWAENNPFELGVNYKCGQEMTLRVMAWIFGLYSFIDEKESTPKRVTTLLKFIYYHIVHIDKHFDFALKSVKNNHVITEAAGMYTVGLLFPFFKESDKWKKKGKKYLEQEGLRQIYEDGSYLQHSMNYQRLVIQNYTWVLQLANLNGDSFSHALKERIKKCVEFLYNHQDENTGFVPNYGMNDGALIHPLTSSDYLDYRPQLNAAWHVLTGERLYEKGLHDENLIWICGTEALSSPVRKIKRMSKAYPVGGYYAIRGKESFGMVRCASYKDRPNQADMLHLDLWHKGSNILTDGGTFSYNTDNRYLNYFNGTSSHNTVMINKMDQMQKYSTFMWLNWTKSKLIAFENFSSGLTIFEGEHYGYKTLTHRRGIIQYQDNWIIIDDIIGDYSEKENLISLSWLFGLPNVTKTSEKEWSINTEEGCWVLEIIEIPRFEAYLYRGNEEPVQGWRSLYYGEKEAVPQLVLNVFANENTRIITSISKKGKFSVKTPLDISSLLRKEGIELQFIGTESMFKGVSKIK
ncbi:alginate lyase family protein [Priestia koreensis]|uniref:alginate lyase family protein n=1 Tax=Priestia koreensis TaxID=284581 RepID=UPI0030160E1B